MTPELHWHEKFLDELLKSFVKKKVRINTCLKGTSKSSSLLVSLTVHHSPASNNNGLDYF